MVYDFSKTCKTYDANSYKKEDFAGTRCPGCGAVGRVRLHASYHRHAMYLSGHELICKFYEIRRIRCFSCKKTHAVMPGDIIPYKTLTLFAVLWVLSLTYIQEKPALKVAEEWGLSFQFIYSVLGAFHRHSGRIHQYFREVSHESTPPGLAACGIISLIRKPFLEFQSGYLKLNKRPCFMCKFFGNARAPSIGRMAPAPPSGGL